MTASQSRVWVVTANSIARSTSQAVVEAKDLSDGSQAWQHTRGHKL